MEELKTALKYFASIFLVLLVSLCIYTFVMTDIMKKDYVNVFGYTYFVIGSGSMSGTIEVDDIIFVKLTKKVKMNDIISYKNKDGDIITHRLIQKNGSKYVTKGDVNNAPDDSIEANQIIGKVMCCISPSFILKSIAVFLIIFIFLALVNFDGIIKKYIVKDNDSKKLDDDNNSADNKENKKEEEISSGLTITINIKDIEEFEKKYEQEEEKNENVEQLEDENDEYLFEDDAPLEDSTRQDEEKEIKDLVLSILKSKKSHITESKLNQKWLEKYQYIYKLCHILLSGNTESFVDAIDKQSFQEIYDYDLEHVGLTEMVRNKIYHMPVYVFLELLTYCILYNDDEMFDGIFKILKYKVVIDKESNFNNPNQDEIKQINNQISFMQEIANRFDEKQVFELDKVERLVKITNS